MNGLGDTDDLQTEEENDEAPFVEFDISVSPADPTLEVLANKVVQGEIIVPFYQRKYVWKIEQASKLIESFLMGLPVPQVFLYVNPNDQLEIIDGQQRIMSIKYFFEGYFGEPDAQGKRQVFRLKGLSERSEYNGKTFDDLPTRDQRRLRNASLRAIHIKQLKPSLRSDSVFHIFERLNTGSTHLKPQEIRNVIYRGRIVDELKQLNDNGDWRKILGIGVPDKNQKDVELVLRLFSLFKKWEHYQKPMLQYLNFRMVEDRDFQSERASEFKDRFGLAVKMVADNLVRPFRPRGVLNSAMLESIMIAIMEDNDISDERLKARYQVLSIDAQFVDSLRGATTDTLVLKGRIKRAKELLKDGPR